MGSIPAGNVLFCGNDIYHYRNYYELYNPYYFRINCIDTFSDLKKFILWFNESEYEIISLLLIMASFHSLPQLKVIELLSLLDVILILAK